MTREWEDAKVNESYTWREALGLMNVSSSISNPGVFCDVVSLTVPLVFLWGKLEIGSSLALSSVSSRS